MSCMPRTVMSTSYKAAYRLLYEAELEQCAARCRLQQEKDRAERALVFITESKTWDLGPVHEAEASVQWWERVIATLTRVLEEQETRDGKNTRMC